MKKRDKKVRLSSIFFYIIKKSKILYIFGIFILLYFLFSWIIYYFDKAAFTNFGDALWFTFASIFTIGYGDFTVTTTLSRIFTAILTIYAVIIISMFTAIWANIIGEIIKANLVNDSKDNKKSPNKDDLI